METKIQFNGQIPQYYQDVLTPFLFDGFSRDLVSKIDFTNVRHVQTALEEIHRVLKKGGKLIFSVWADINANPVWDISGKVIASYLGANPMLKDPGPFSLADESKTLKILEDAGFKNSTAHQVDQSGNIETAAMAAAGFVEGLPVFMAISKKDPALVHDIKQALEPKLSEALGEHPLCSPLQAWVFEAIK